MITSLRIGYCRKHETSARKGIMLQRLMVLVVLVLCGSLTENPLFGASLLEQCLNKAPAGIALTDHLAKARSGNVESMWCAGAIHLYHQKRVNDAIPWLTQAANAGHMRAPLVLGILYEKGEGVTEDHALAAKWYQKAMDNGNVAAIRRLSEMYRLGMGVPHDEKKARELLTRAEELGDKAAPKFREKQEHDRLHPKPGQDIKAEAYRAHKQKQFEKAAKLYQQCAAMGNDDCQLALGVIYEYGEGVPKNDGQAVVWYRKSADQGNPIGQKTLGLMYELGKGVPENWAEAARLYSMSAEKYQDAAFALGRMYEFGMSVPQNRARAIEWFKKAADLEHPKGAYWARWLNDYTNCIGFRNAQEQQTLGFLRCPADPVGVIFRNNSERLAYMREKGKEFDIMEATAAAARAARVEAKSNSECNSAGGTWSPDRQATLGGSCN